MSCGELVSVILWAMLCSLITGVTGYYLGKLSYKKPFWEKLVTLLFSVLVGIITFIVIVVILEAVVSG